MKKINFSIFCFALCAMLFALPLGQLPARRALPLGERFFWAGGCVPLAHSQKADNVTSPAKVDGVAGASKWNGVTVAGGGDSCTGGLLFSWHCENLDVTVGTPAGCSVGDTTGTLTGSASISTDYAKDGTNSVKAIHAGDYYAFTVTSSDIIKSGAGTLDFWVYFVSWQDTLTPFLANYDSDNRQYISFNNSTYQMVYTFIGAGVTKTATTTVSGNIQQATWYHIIAKWDTTAHSGAYMQICMDTTTGTTQCGTNTVSLPTMTAASEIRFGDAAWGDGTSYFDLVKIYSTWQ